jgi:diguanylate cyclase (GGDEF)-like protein/PAS domain S-box-containing protein
MNTMQLKKGERVEKYLGKILEAMPDLAAAFGIDGYLLYLNRGGRGLLGIGESEEISNINIRDLYPKKVLLLIIEKAIPDAVKFDVWNGETTLVSRKGHEWSVSQVITAHKNSKGEIEFLSTIARDISEQKYGDKAVQMFAGVFNCTQEGVMVTDASIKILAVNPAFSFVTGYAPEEVIGKNPRILQSGRHDAAFYKQFWISLKTMGQWQGEIWNRRKNGEIYPEWLTINAVKDEVGVVTNYVAVFSDISSLKISEHHLTLLAYHDALTGLPNRLLFYERLKLTLAQAHRNRGRVAVIFIDLDRFKPINDTLGHYVGDLLLQEVAERLRSCVREGDTAARVGGDEFMMILAEIHGRPDVEVIIRKILDRLSHPFLLEGHRMSIGASLGISLYPDDAVEMENLIKEADFAMYQAKQQGGNRYQFYNLYT